MIRTVTVPGPKRDYESGPKRGPIHGSVWTFHLGNQLTKGPLTSLVLNIVVNICVFLFSKLQ